MEAVKKEPKRKLSPLLIPDRDVQRWEHTHPLEQIKWTWNKNRSTNGHYVNVVKAVKWWRRINHATPKYPKGYPVEHLIGVCCPDKLDSVAAGVTTTLEGIAERYKIYAATEQTPFLSDHGVPDHNVMRRVSGKDFAKFHEQVCGAAKVARTALDADTVKEALINGGSCLETSFLKHQTMAMTAESKAVAQRAAILLVRKCRMLWVGDLPEHDDRPTIR